jgi:hypothetical protein
MTNYFGPKKYVSCEWNLGDYCHYESLNMCSRDDVFAVNCTNNLCMQIFHLIDDDKVREACFKMYLHIGNACNF